MNLVLPVFVFTVLLMAGEPRPAAEVGEVSPGGMAAAAGLLPGDRIAQVGRAPVQTFGELAEALRNAGAAHLALAGRPRDIAAIDDYCFAGGPTLSFVQKALARLGLETDA